MNKQAIFYIALPGAGKTTHIHNSNFPYKVISADTLKEKHPNYNPEKAFELHQWSVKEAEQQVYESIKNNESFVFDSGGINDHYSLRIIHTTKAAGYYITLYFIDTPFYECINRINKRDRKVPIEDIFTKSLKLMRSLYLQRELCDKFIHVPFYTNKHIFLDMDGTVVEYTAQTLRPNNLPQEFTVDYINNNLFEFANPVKEMVRIVKQYFFTGSKIYILSVSPNSETSKQKIAWLKRNMPFVEEEYIYFVGNGEKKVSTLLQIITKRELNKKDVTYVDDIHSMVWEASNNGLNALHVSSFLTTKF